MKIPGPDHPIDVAPLVGRICVTWNGETIAESDNALELREAEYPSVAYIPRADVAMDKLAASDHKTHCPYKGDASYFSIEAGGERSENAVWSYTKPYAAFEIIQDHVAFYPDRVDAIERSAS